VNFYHFKFLPNKLNPINMKQLSTLFALLLMVSVIAVNAQTKAKTTTTAKATSISDQDLKKYAMTMDSVRGMQETLQQIIAENVQKNTVMTVERYNQLFKIADDQAKLAEAQATPEEVAFLKEIADLRTLNTARINSTYQALAKDYVGLKAFNAIKKSLASDPDLKARYETVSKETGSTGASGSN
jgi:hypothetical protein